MKDLTGTRLFFELLQTARKMKTWPPKLRRIYLRGMTSTMEINKEDFRIADNARDSWKNQSCGAE